MKTSPWIALMPAALVLLATVTGDVAARETEKAQQVFETGAQPRLSLKNINGGLTIDGWDKNRIEVSIVKTASSQERLDDVRVDVRMDDDHLRIDVRYEDDDDWDDGEKMPSVDFTIHVPHGTRINKVEMVNGNIVINGVDGDVDASSVNGAVSGEKLGGDVTLSAVNGTVTLLANGGVDSIRLNSVNGGVLLVLPKHFDARIQAGTLNGTIRAVDGLDVDATSFTGSSMHGTIGKGGMKVDLNTVNGSIEIRREGESRSRERE